MIRPSKKDFDIVFQNNLDIKVDVLVLNQNGTAIGNINGSVINCSSSIDSTSDIRRTFNLEMQVNSDTFNLLNDTSIVWLDKEFVIKVAIFNYSTQEYQYYPQGSYFAIDGSVKYDATSHALSTSLVDKVAKLNGDLGGILGGFIQYTLPCIKNKEEIKNETVYEYYTISETIRTVLNDLSLSDYYIGEFGELKGLPCYNKNYISYRKENNNWDKLPYDLEFQNGVSGYEVIKKIINLYPNNVAYYNENGIFFCKNYNSNNIEEVILDIDFFEKIIIDENAKIDFTSIKNISEVWGKPIDMSKDRYSENCILENNIYKVTIDGMESYGNNNLIAIKIPSSNPENVMIQINNLNTIYVYDLDTDDYLNKNTLDENITYIFKYKNEKFYYMCKFQPHAIDVLSDGTTLPLPSKTYEKYSVEYFKDKYICQKVNISISKDSPFTVQKIGEILDVKSGEDYENAWSDYEAMEWAKYENAINSRQNDTITITTSIVPWLDVDIIVRYKSLHNDQINKYIIKKIDHDFLNGTDTITMYRYYEEI